MELSKFIPFCKVDVAKREVSGVVTAERPDKEFEVCDYAASKPYYEKWSDGFSKATEGKSFGNLRIMHQLQVAGKAIEPIKFDDEEKSITMTFKVVDDDAWKKVEERVFTGFSQGGRKVGDMRRDPVFKNCMRYVADPAEISLVDNPCLPDARFAFVRADGTIEMRKFLKIEEPVEAEVFATQASQRIADLESQVTLLKADLGKRSVIPGVGQAVPAVAVAAAEEDVIKAKTKRVAGKDLPASSFAYVGDPDKTETWKFPIHDASHVRNALARWNQAKGIPASAKARVRAKIVAAAKKFGVEVSDEKAAAIAAVVRKAARRFINLNWEKIVSKRMRDLDTDLGKLNKGMYEVSNMAHRIQDLCYLLNAVTAEQQYELDEDSELPGLLAENIEDLVDTFLAMVNEECGELREYLGKEPDEKDD